MHSQPLPDLILPNNANQVWSFSGMDCLDDCADKEHFRRYPFSVEYRYNSRGFRDEEWPANQRQLRDAIWCIGDSFTVGIGAPFAHIWPRVLSQSLGRPTINISMDGASNNWIARRARYIMDQINPSHMIIMWSYLHRREIDDPTLSDEARRVWHWKKDTLQDLFDNFSACKKAIINSATQVVQLAIPDYKFMVVLPEEIQDDWQKLQGTDWPKQCPRSHEEFLSLPESILAEIEHLHQSLDLFQSYYIGQSLFGDVIETPCLDLARDGHHFDILTAQHVVKQVKPFFV